MALLCCTGSRFFFAALSDALTNGAIFLKVIDTHRFSFLMHWMEFLPQHAKADKPELPKGLSQKGCYGGRIHRVYRMVFSACPQPSHLIREDDFCFLFPSRSVYVGERNQSASVWCCYLIVLVHRLSSGDLQLPL